MKNKTACALSLALMSIVLTFGACKKQIEKDLERQTSRWEGTWQVARIRVVTTDTLGATLRDTTMTGQGTVEFRRATEEGADVFDPVLFRGACAQSDLIGYFRSNVAGDPTTDGGWSLYWEADPSGERVMFWGIGPLSSYHRTLNLDFDGKGKSARTISYVRSPGIGSNELEFVTWDLAK